MQSPASLEPPAFLTSLVDSLLEITPERCRIAVLQRQIADLQQQLADARETIEDRDEQLREARGEISSLSWQLEGDGHHYL